MNFEDLNAMEFLVHKADFLTRITKDPTSVKQALVDLKDNSKSTFNDVFNMIIKYIETKKVTITDQLIEDLIKYSFEVYEIEPVFIDNYINLSKCFVNENIGLYNVKELFNENFIKNATLYFNIMFASYYLNVLIERTYDMDEINRINCLLKDSISEYKLKTGRI